MLAQEFDIIVVKSKGVIPFLIRKFTKSNWNHAAIVCEIHGELMVAQAINSGFRITHKWNDYLRETYDGKRQIMVRRSKDAFCVVSARKRFIELLGNKYEFLNLFVFQAIKAITGHYVGTTNRNRVICSEADAYILKQAFPNYYEVTPHELSVSDNLVTLFKYGKEEKINDDLTPGYLK